MRPSAVAGPSAAADPSVVAGPPTAAGGRSLDIAAAAALALLVALAAALRFTALGAQSLWFDEAATWDLVREPFGTMLRAIPDRESTPPLFYVLEWGWTRLFGDGEAGLRSLSALAGTLTVLVAYALGRRLGGRRAALAAAALVAVNPLLVWFSQEARAYALVVLLSALALLALLRALEDPRLRVLATWALLAALALATHYFAAFAIAPQAVWLLRRHAYPRAALVAAWGVAVAGAALLPLLQAQHANPYDIADSSLALRAVQVPKQLLLGYRGPLVVPFALAGAALAAAGAWLLLRRPAAVGGGLARGVAAVGALAVLLPLAPAVLGVDYLNARNALPALVPLLTALGAAYAASRPAWLGTALLGALCAISLAIVIAVAADPGYQRTDWAGLARALGRAPVARAIVIAPANGELPLRYYRRALRPLPEGGIALSGVDVIGVAGSTSAGGAPRLPEQVGTALGVAGFGPPRRIAAERHVILRFRAPHPIHVTPAALATVRFSQAPPSVALLPARR